MPPLVMKHLAAVDDVLVPLEHGPSGHGGGVGAGARLGQAEVRTALRPRASGVCLLQLLVVGGEHDGLSTPALHTPRISWCWCQKLASSSMAMQMEQQVGSDPVQLLGEERRPSSSSGARRLEHVPGCFARGAQMSAARGLDLVLGQSPRPSAGACLSSSFSSHMIPSCFPSRGSGTMPNPCSSGITLEADRSLMIMELAPAAAAADARAAVAAAPRAQFAAGARVVTMPDCRRRSIGRPKAMAPPVDVAVSARPRGPGPA